MPPSLSPSLSPSVSLPQLPPEILVPPPGPRSRALGARLAAVESPDLTAVGDDFPVFWESAVGANVWDADGNRYLDLDAGFGVAAVGHAHPRVVEAIREGAGRLIHGMGDVHPNEARLALCERLASFGPDRATRWKALLATSGSEAVEAAMKTAALATGRAGVVVFENAYHGLTIGALGATAWPRFREGLGGVLAGAERFKRFPFPTTPAHDPAVGATNASAILDAIDSFLASREGGEFGAILVEPIQGRGGIVVPPDGFLTGLAAIARTRGLLTIHDEVYTGFHRTGPRFASEAEGPGAAPDILAAGKALGGGMPVSVCLARADVMDAWRGDGGEARHTSTFIGHPLSCAAALAALDVFEAESLGERSASGGERLRAALRSRLDAFPEFRDARGRGMMIGVEFRTGRGAQADRAFAWSIVVEALRGGLVVLPCGPDGATIAVSPALGLSDETIALAAAEFAGAVARARGH